MKPPKSSAEILAYFSHSYRPEDLAPNLFFWHLFAGEGFFFSVDRRSDFLSVPYLEYMMQRSSCFVAVVTLRKEQIGSRCSPYILFEYGLAVQAKRPKLVFVERGVNRELFEDDATTVTFERNVLDSFRKDFKYHIRKLAEKARGYRDLYTRLHGKAGIIIDPGNNARKIYSKPVIDRLAQKIGPLGFKLVELRPKFDKSYEFCLAMDELDFLILDEHPALLSPWISGYIFGRFFPCIRLCHLENDEPDRSVKFSSLLYMYYNLNPKSERMDSIIFWRNQKQLITQTIRHIDKFERERDIFKTREEGDKYFLSLGRRRAKVFVSNADSVNPLASELAKKLDTEHFIFFHYKDEDAIQIGEDWQKSLDKELDHSELLVALIDKNYFNKKWCVHEFNVARRRSNAGKIKIYPYILEKEIPSALDKIQGTQVYAWSNEAIIDRIIQDVDKFLKKT